MLLAWLLLSKVNHKGNKAARRVEYNLLVAFRLDSLTVTDAKVRAIHNLKILPILPVCQVRLAPVGALCLYEPYVKRSHVIPLSAFRANIETELHTGLSSAPRVRGPDKTPLLMIVATHSAHLCKRASLIYINRIVDIPVRTRQGKRIGSVVDVAS